jgi:hypothetical protein
MGLHKYGPKEPLSPSIGDLCRVCGLPFKAGDYTALIRTTSTSTYGNERIEVHWECATKPAE